MFSQETQALMEAAVDAIIVIDHRGCMTSVNTAACRMFGFQLEEMLGENVSLLMREPDRSAHDGYLSRHLATGQARIIGIGREVVARRKDGSQFPVRLSVGSIPGALPPRFVGLVRDISNEYAATAALKLERDRANAFLELHDSILLELDATRRVRDINSRGSKLLGAAVLDVCGCDWLDFMEGESERERAQSMLDSALASGRSREQEFDVVDLGGVQRRIQWRCIALRAADGAPAGWLCSGADVTDRAQREERAHVTQDRLTRVARLATMGEMASGVAHELNQPLAAITAYAHACERYLEAPQPDVAELREAVQQISSEGFRAGEIIRRLRRMVRSDDADGRAPLDVNPLIEELRALLLADARVHDARLLISLTPKLPRVVANAVQLQQVVLNLVRNAFEALQESPVGRREVELVTASVDATELEIRVSDNGPGIAPQIADRLFDPFATTKGAGTGLGLAISRTIVQTHGGTIGTRKSVPNGATFYVRLPALEEFET